MSSTNGVHDLLRQHQSAAWFIAGAAITTMFTAAIGLQLTRHAATTSEAHLAAVTAAVNLGGPAGAGWPDTGATRQLAAVGYLLDADRAAAVIDITRAAALIFAVLACLLIFPVARRLTFHPASATAAAALAAVTVGLAQLGTGADAGAVALAWLTLAALLALTPAAAARWGAWAAAAVGVLTTPVAAVGLLVLGGHLVAISVVAPGLPDRARRAVVAAALLGAVVVAVLATGGRVLAPAFPSTLPLPFTLLVVAGAGIVVALGWWLLDWLRPVCSGTAALLACGLVPGAGFGTVAILALPVVAVLVIALADSALAALPGDTLVGAVGVLSLLVAAPAVALMLGTPRGEAGAELSGWLAEQLDPAQVVLVDELTGAQLVRDGIPASRLHSITDPAAPPGAVIVLSGHTGARLPDDAATGPVLASFATGPGRAPSEVRLSGRQQTDAARADTTRADAADRARFGTALAGNRSVSCGPDAAAVLRAGGVDPRLMSVLAALAAAHHITVAEFLTVAAEPADAPRRTAVIATFDGTPTSDPATAQVLGQWLQRQLPPYSPTLMPRVGDLLRVRFPAPSPVGLLTG